MPQVSEALLPPPPPTPPAEAVRLAAVRRTTLLDTPPDQAFDRLTRLAARLLGTPIALISLVDDDREFFLSASGLAEPLATSRTTPLSYSFSRHIVEAGTRLVIDDARRHPLVRTNPAVRELGWVAYAGVPLVDARGQVLGALSVIDAMPRLWSERDLDLLEDLAIWAVTEIELRAAPPSDEYATRAFEEIPVPTAIVSEEGRCIRVNKAFGYLFGVEPGDLVDRAVEDLTHPDDRSADREAMRLLLAGECHSYSAEKRVLAKSDEPVWVLATVTRVSRRHGGGDYFVLSFEQPGEPAEPVPVEAGDRNEERYRLLSESVGDFIWDWDLLTDRIEWVGGWRGFAGYGRDQLGDSAAWWYERLHPDERERVVGGIHGVVARGESVWSDEYRFRRLDGSWAHVEVRGSIVRDEGGDAVRMVGATLDVSDRKRADLVLRCQSTILRDIASGMELDDVLRRIASLSEAYSGSVAAVHLLAADGSALRLGAAPSLPAAYAGTIAHIPLESGGGPWAAAVQRREGVISPDIAADELWSGWRDAALADELRSAWVSPLLGAGRVVLGTLALFGREAHAPNADDARMLEIATDLARIAVQRERNQEALRRSEEDLRQAQKMEAVGQLAGGVAHDFNNLLTGVLSYSDLIQQQLSPDDPVRSDLEQIRHAAQRAAALTRQLLAFSRRQLLQPKVLSLNEAITEMESMLRRLLGNGVMLEITLDPGLWYVMADPGQLEQVLVNLTVNARDAMPQGGRLTIATANCRVGAEGPERAGGVRPGSYATLTVSDTGVGMDVATQARIFEPFFTTKDIGSGTGLGLSSVYGIVEQSGGHVTAQSAPGRGATFTIYLPRHAEPGASPAGNPDRRSLPTGTETILLVEDESTVRTSTRRLLERHGYTVVEARHGLEALRVVENSASRFDLVVTDLVMPEMGGTELIERLRTRTPGLKVLFMSGYSERVLAGEGRLPPDTGFLEKPFTVEQLMRRLRKILDG
jgi:two-component system cell cycle sensor histidine kinase/response regulator CckA